MPPDSDAQPMIFEARHLVAIIKTSEDVKDIKEQIGDLNKQIKEMAEDARTCTIGHENRIAILEKESNDKRAVTTWWQMGTSRAMTVGLFLLAVLGFAWDNIRGFFFH